MLLEDTSDPHLISYLGESVSEQKLYLDIHESKVLIETEVFFIKVLKLSSYKSADTDQDWKKDF